MNVFELVNSIQEYLLKKYSGKGKDLFQIFKDGEMDPGDAEQYQFVLEKTAV